MNEAIPEHSFGKSLNWLSEAPGKRPRCDGTDHALLHQRLQGRSIAVERRAALGVSDHDLVSSCPDHLEHWDHARCLRNRGRLKQQPWSISEVQRLKLGVIEIYRPRECNLGTRNNLERNAFVIEGLPHLLSSSIERLGIVVRPFPAHMRSSGDGRGPRLHCCPRERDRVGPGLRTVVDTPENVKVEVDQHGAA